MGKLEMQEMMETTVLGGQEVRVALPELQVVQEPMVKLVIQETTELLVQVVQQEQLAPKELLARTEIQERMVLAVLEVLEELQEIQEQLALVAAAVAAAVPEEVEHSPKIRPKPSVHQETQDSLEEVCLVQEMGVWAVAVVRVLAFFKIKTPHPLVVQEAQDRLEMQVV